VNTAEASRVIGNEFTKEVPGAGAVFVIVDYTERNDGTESYTGAGAPIELHDSQGHSYTSSSRAGSALALAGAEVQLLPELQPGVQQAAKVAFEIPETAIAQPVTLVVKERGLFASGQVNIPVTLKAPPPAPPAGTPPVGMPPEGMPMGTPPVGMPMATPPMGMPMTPPPMTPMPMGPPPGGEPTKLPGQ
jgi:hypothetical protein